jgi:hypothetical protein
MKFKKPAKNITLDKLAVMVGQGFNDLTEGMNGKFNKVDSRFDKVENRLAKVEMNMVSKEYLDEKLLSLKGDLTILMRKEDIKVRALVDLLVHKRIINSEEAGKILALEPFPQS